MTTGDDQYYATLMKGGERRKTQMAALWWSLTRAQNKRLGPMYVQGKVLDMEALRKKEMTENEFADKVKEIMRRQCICLPHKMLLRKLLYRTLNSTTTAEVVCPALVDAK